MITKILFIIPNNGLTGGTVSSLRSILYVLQLNKFEPYVYPIHRSGKEFSEILAPEVGIISAYYNQLKAIKGWRKIPSLAIKLLKRIESYLPFRVEDFVGKIGMWEIERHGKYDVVIGFEEYSPTYIASWAKSAKKKIAWVQLDYGRYHEENGGKDEYDYYSRFDNIICVSKYTANRFKEVYPSLANKTSFIYNLIDQNYILEKALSQEPLDERYRTDLFTIVSIGRIDPIKRFEYIPGIAKKLVDKDLHFRWYVLGDTIYPEHKNAVIEEITRHCVESNVILLGNKQNPYPYLAKSNLLVVLSRSESFSIVIAEAKQLGVPIVSTDFPVAYEVLDNCGTGIISPIESIDEVLFSLIDENSYLIKKPLPLLEKTGENERIIEQILTLLSI